MKKVLLFLLFSLSLSAQAQLNLDSLKAQTDVIESDSLKVLTYIRIAFVYNRIDYDSALHYNMKAIALSKALNSGDLLGRSKYRVAVTYMQKDQLDLAKAELDTAIQLLEQSGNSQHLLSAKVGMARLYQSRSDFDRSVALYFEALGLAEEIADKNTEARIMNYLASIYNYQKQFDLAISYFQKALKLVEELQFSPGISAVLTNLGEVYLNVEKYDSAIVYHRKALKIKQQMGDKLGSGRVYNNLANVFVNSRSPHLDSSVYFYQKGLAIARDLHDAQLKGLSLYGLTRVSFIKGDFNVAERYSSELYNSLDSIQDLSLAASTYDLLSLINASQGDVEGSMQFRSRSKTLEDSLLSSERIQLTKELEAKYQNEAKQKTIQLLEAENKLQDLQINKRQNERNGLIVLFIVVLLILAMLYNQYRIKQSANEKLKDLDRMKSTFFENLSHEFRTPLSLIIAPVKDRLGHADKADEEFLNLILRNAENLDDLIKQLLDLAKLEKGVYELKLEAVEVASFFSIIVSSYESLAGMKNISFTSSTPTDECWIMADEDLIRKVSNNLLSNAFKFTPEGGSVAIDVSYNQSLVISISDTGRGISKSEQDKIFERFYQVEGPHHIGTGIGLALTKELVEAAGGTIMVTSEPKVGAKFTVSIPAKLAKSNPTQSMDYSEDNVDEFQGDAIVDDNKPGLLVIEDNDDLRAYLAGLFDNEYNVYKSDNGQKGIEAALETIPDLIISDIMMEEMDGLEVCKIIKSDPRTDHIPIVLLTARIDQETKLQGLRNGADAYLLKPFEPEELRTITKNLIDQRERLRDKYAKSMIDQDLKPDTHPFIDKCQAIISQNLSDERFTVDAFAKEVAMSRMQVHRKLKALTGYSATGFIRHFRLTKAEELLLKGEPVSQVAYAVGFSSLAYFTKSFKEQFGQLPSQIAKKQVS